MGDNLMFVSLVCLWVTVMLGDCDDTKLTKRVEALEAAAVCLPAEAP